MNIFEAFKNKECENMPAIAGAKRIYTIKDLKPLIAPQAAELLKNPVKNVLILSENNFDFVINFLSAVFAKKEIFLLSDSKKASQLDFEYIVLEKVCGLKNPDCADFEFFVPDFQTTFATVFTSGSTGKPKRVKKSFENIFVEAEDIINAAKTALKAELTPVLTSSTPHHMFGLTCWMFLAFFDPKRFLLNAREVVYPDRAEFGGAIFVSTPSFLEKFKKYDVILDEKPVLVMTAGDRLKDETYDYFEKYNVPVLDIYGSTETGVIAYKTEKNEQILRCFKSVETDSDMDSQIVIKSPYFLEKTAVLCDIIERIDSKHFRLKNRSDRIVKIQEKRVSAIEIETFVRNLEMIEDAYCFKYGEKLACAAVLNDSGKDFYLDEENGGRQKLIKNLKAALKDKSEIIPQKWRFLHEIPRTKTGKIDKSKIERVFSTNISLPLVLKSEKSADYARYELVFAKNCNFFDGHFKNFPILPGVVQLYFAHMFAQEAFEKKVAENPVKKIKFSHLIKPAERLALEFKFDGKNIFYAYKNDEMTCSSGVFSTKE